MRILLDTNAYAEWKRGNEAVAALVKGAEELLVSAVVAGELEYGFRRGRRYEEDVRELERLLESPFVTFLPVTRTTVDRFGRVAASLRKKGRPLPTNDIWIAAHALESGADLVSFDLHFEVVDGIAWVRPV